MGTCGSVQLKACRNTGEAHNVLGLGQPGLPIPHFYRQGPGRAAAQALTFIDRAWASLAPQPLTFIDRNLSPFSTGPGQPGHQPLTSIGQTPHFYQPSQPAPIPKNCEPPNHRCNCSAPNSKHQLHTATCIALEAVNRFTRIYSLSTFTLQDKHLVALARVP